MICFPSVKSVKLLGLEKLGQGSEKPRLIYHEDAENYPPNISILLST